MSAAAIVWYWVVNAYRMYNTIQEIMRSHKILITVSKASSLVQLEA